VNSDHHGVVKDAQAIIWSKVGRKREMKEAKGREEKAIQSVIPASCL